MNSICTLPFVRRYRGAIASQHRMQDMIGLDIGGSGAAPSDDLRPAPWYGMSPAQAAANGFVPGPVGAPPPPLPQQQQWHDHQQPQQQPQQQQLQQQQPPPQQQQHLQYQPQQLQQQQQQLSSFVDSMWRQTTI
jgi:hypothetical protein